MMMTVTVACPWSKVSWYYFSRMLKNVVEIYNLLYKLVVSKSIIKTHIYHVICFIVKYENTCKKMMLFMWTTSKYNLYGKLNNLHLLNGLLVYFQLKTKLPSKKTIVNSRVCWVDSTPFSVRSCVPALY